MLRFKTRKLVYAAVIASVCLWVLTLALAPRWRGVAAALNRPLVAIGSEFSELQQSLRLWLQPAQRQQRQQNLLLQVAVLEQRIQLLEAAEHENQELRRIVELAPPAQWQRVVAPVIARSPAEWNLRFRIGRGRNHGIKVGYIVLHDAAVIGRILEVAADSSVVQTIADPGCRLSVRASATSAAGVLRGKKYAKWHGKAYCLLDYMPRDQTYHRGQMVVTSGLSTMIPPGLRVGRIVAWPDNDQVAHVVETVYSQLLIEPVASLAFFRHVVVLVPEPATTAGATPGADRGRQ